MKIFKLLFAVALSQVEEEQADSARPARKNKVETSFDKVSSIFRTFELMRTLRIQLMAKELATTTH